MPPAKQPSPPLDRDAARRAAVNLLRVRDRSSDELRERLIARGASGALASRVVEEFERARLVSDARLAEHTIARELETGPVGRLRLQDRLARRMIDDTLAARAIDSALRGRRGADDAIAAARQILEKLTGKSGTRSKPPGRQMRSRTQLETRLDPKLWRRIAAALARRGFSDDEIERAMDALGPPPESSPD
ncbi:MAG: RecX family transcriptional regulator [Phycisphaerales bacterium]|jgi:SOS response regulatory protein OraA/RecX|nr:RecX family transcriptional regulator [Phycisphaerales bacterium]